MTLCDPMDYSPPGSFVHGILQARILEWVAIPSSGGVFPTQGLNTGLLHSGQILYCLNYQLSLLILVIKQVSKGGLSSSYVMIASLSLHVPFLSGEKSVSFLIV